MTTWAWELSEVDTKYHARQIRLVVIKWFYTIKDHEQSTGNPLIIFKMSFRDIIMIKLSQPLTSCVK